ncbi:MAG: hypothetical protein ACTSYX_00840 [Candidatus Thorarchaeota archaeon]
MLSFVSVQLDGLPPRTGHATTSNRVYLLGVGTIVIVAVYTAVLRAALGAEAADFSHRYYYPGFPLGFPLMYVDLGGSLLLALVILAILSVYFNSEYNNSAITCAAHIILLSHILRTSQVVEYCFALLWSPNPQEILHVATQMVFWVADIMLLLYLAQVVYRLLIIGGLRSLVARANFYQRAAGFGHHEAGEVQVARGYEVAGENVKVAIKVENGGSLAILNVQVILNVPDGFALAEGSSSYCELGNIAPGGFQSAIFWLKPLRCVDDEISGVVMFKDAGGDLRTIPIEPKRIVNICPMLHSTERVDEVFKKLKYNALERNCVSFRFKGSSKTVFSLAQVRLSGLVPVDYSESTFEDGVSLGYSCYVGETKYGQNQFAVEIQATGSDSSGVLTVTVYSDDKRILSGFFSDIMPSVREHIEIVEEQACPILTCPKCGANINPMTIQENRLYRCEYCGALVKMPPWLS